MNILEELKDYDDNSSIPQHLKDAANKIAKLLIKNIAENIKLQKRAKEFLDFNSKY